MINLVIKVSQRNPSEDGRQIARHINFLKRFLNHFARLSFIVQFEWNKTFIETRKYRTGIHSDHLLSFTRARSSTLAVNKGNPFEADDQKQFSAVRQQKKSLNLIKCVKVLLHYVRSRKLSPLASFRINLWKNSTAEESRKQLFHRIRRKLSISLSHSTRSLST